MKNTKTLFYTLFLGLALASGISFAWNAVWHGTDWIQAGETIRSTNIAENFEFLYSRAGKLPEGGCPNVGDILVWNGSNFECQNLDSLQGGGGTCSNGSQNLVSSSKTVSDCTNAGGLAVDIGGGSCICKFAASSCPSGWTQYQEWSETLSNSCDGGECGYSCTTSSHAFSNQAVETCRYAYGTKASGDGAMCTNSIRRTCYANIRSIGCN